VSVQRYVISPLVASGSREHSYFSSQDHRAVQWCSNPNGSGSELGTVSFHYDIPAVKAETRQVFNRIMPLSILFAQLVRTIIICCPLFDPRSQRVCSKFLLPVLKREQEHIKLPGLITRAQEVEYRMTCGKYFVFLLSVEHCLMVTDEIFVVHASSRKPGYAPFVVETCVRRAKLIKSRLVLSRLLG
jgi:hypothetical protein